LYGGAAFSRKIRIIELAVLITDLEHQAAQLKKNRPFGLGTGTGTW
jgi:hypothetical protein